jgi:hypothetical protein
MTTFTKRRAAGRAGPHPPPAGTGRPVPAWARWAAEIAAFAPVPSSLWRLPLIFGVSMGMDADFMADLMDHPLWFRAAYLLGLGVVSDGAAFLTLGLVRWWGETWPRWVPFAGGRRVHPLAAIVPALAGGVLMTCLAVAMASGWNSNVTHGYNGWEILQTAMYAPLLLWGPLLLLVTGQYAWRRRPR